MRMVVIIDSVAREIVLSPEQSRILHNLASAQEVSLAQIIEFILEDYCMIVSRHEQEIFNQHPTPPEEVN